MALYDYSEAAERLNLKKGTLRKWVCTGKIGYIKIGSRVFFDDDIINSYIENHRVEAEG